MSKMKFSLSKTGCNWVAVPTGSISKNQSVSRQKMKKAVSANKNASFGMSNSKISLGVNIQLVKPSFNNIFLHGMVGVGAHTGDESCSLRLVAAG